MTSIAWDGKTLASDSRTTGDGVVITDNHQKIHKLNVQYRGDDLLAIGIAGPCVDVQMVLDNVGILVDGPKHEIHAIIIGRDKVYELVPGKWYLIEYKKNTKLGAGSGEKIILSALTLGLDAVAAVKHAIKLDIYTGGKVQTWEEE